MEKQERQIILAGNQIRVSGDFGGGYTAWLVETKSRRGLMQ